MDKKKTQIDIEAKERLRQTKKASQNRKSMSYSGVPITPHEIIYEIKHLKAEKFVGFVQSVLYGYLKNTKTSADRLTITRSVFDRKYHACYCELVDSHTNMYYSRVDQEVRTGQIVDAAGKVSLFGGLINIVTVTRVYEKSEVDSISVKTLEDEIQKYTPAPKWGNLQNKYAEIIDKLRKYEHSSLVLKVGTILRNYVPSQTGAPFYLHVSGYEAGTFAKTYYCEMVDDNGLLYYGYTPMRVHNGMKICVTNPMHVPLANCFAVTIIADKKTKGQQKTDSTIVKDNKKSSSTKSRKKGYFRPHQFYDPLRAEWRDKIKDYRIFKYPVAGVCSKCKRMFGEGEGFIVRKCNVFLCDACRESLRPSTQSKYKDPRAHFISVPMGGQKKK